MSLGNFGCLRTTMDLKVADLYVGERHVWWLIKVNGAKPVRARRRKVTTNRQLCSGVIANWPEIDFVVDTRNQSKSGDVTYTVQQRLHTHA